MANSWAGVFCPQSNAWWGGAPRVTPPTPPPWCGGVPPRATPAVNRRFLDGVGWGWQPARAPGHWGGFGNAAGSCHLHPNTFRNPGEDGALSPSRPGTPDAALSCGGAAQGSPCPLWGAGTGVPGVWCGRYYHSYAHRQSWERGGFGVRTDPAGPRCLTAWDTLTGHNTHRNGTEQAPAHCDLAGSWEDMAQ